MCHYENKNETDDENESFRSFWIEPVTNKPGSQYYATLHHQFVRHALIPEQTKALGFVFVFVCADEQAISKKKSAPFLL